MGILAKAPDDFVVCGHEAVKGVEQHIHSIEHSLATPESAWPESSNPKETHQGLQMASNSHANRV